MEFLIVFLATGLIILMFLGSFYIFGKKIFFWGRYVLAGIILIYVLIFLIKFFYFVERPYQVNKTSPLVLVPPTDSSFPSSHAALAFFIATLVYLKNKKVGFFYYFLAILVGWGRIMANVHYPIDVLGGGLLGLGVAYIIKFLLSRTGNFTD